MSMDIELDFEKRYRLHREVIETLVLTVLMFLVIRLAVQNFQIDGTSMESTLHNSELVLVDKWTYHFHAPQRGDVVVFDAPPQPGTDYIKRIIAVPGDVITVNNGVPTVNGVTLKEFYVAPCHLGAYFSDQPVNHEVVPPNDYFVMGDNRIGSYDSRSWGFVPAKNIVGRAALVYWPLRQDNYGLLANASSVFAHVPNPTHTSATPSPLPFTLSFTSSSFATLFTTPTLSSHPHTHTVDMDSVFLLAMPALYVVCYRYRKKRNKH